MQYGYSIAAVLGDATPIAPQGARIVPGDYRVVLNVDGREFQQPLHVAADPRVQATRADLEQILRFWQSIEIELARVWQVHGEIDAVQSQLDALTKGGGAMAHASLKSSIAAVTKKIEPLRAGKGESAPNFGTIGDVLATLATDVEGADRLPTQPQQQVLDEYRARTDRALAAWQDVRRRELASLDAELAHAGLAPIHVPAVDEIRDSAPAESVDLP